MVTMSGGRKTFSPLFICCAAGSLIWVSGCESPQSEAAHKIADALPALIGPARHYTVSVQGNAFALAQGRASEVEVAGQQVQIAKATVLDAAELRAQNVVFDTHTHRVARADDVQLMAVIGQANLTRYIDAHNRSLPNLTVTLEMSSAEVRLPIHALGLQSTALVNGTLRVDPSNAKAVDFIADQASIGAVPVPAMLVNDALKLVGPVFDLSSLRFPVAITRASVENSQIILQGTADLQDASSP